MQTQGHTPDPKCELSIPSFLTLPCPLDILICANDIMIIVLLLHMMRGWEGWEVVQLCYGLVGRQGVGMIVILFFVQFFCCC